MIRTEEELSTLSPTPVEIVFSAVSALHVLLILVLFVLVLRDRVRVPDGAIWVAILLLVPVLGPLVVLHRGRRSGADRTDG